MVEIIDIMGQFLRELFASGLSLVVLGLLMFVMILVFGFGILLKAVDHIRTAGKSKEGGKAAYYEHYDDLNEVEE